MANLPTVEEVEDEILRIFAKHGVRPGEMLLAQSFIASLDHSKFRVSDLPSGFKSLGDKNEIEQKAGKSPYAIFLTESGYQRLPSTSQIAQAASSPVTTLQGSVTLNVSGTGARVNIGSTDNSVNTFNLGAPLLNAIVEDLKALPDQPGKNAAIHAAEELKSHQGKSTFAEKYRAFMSSISDHASIFSIIAPYLGDLAELLSP